MRLAAVDHLTVRLPVVDHLTPKVLGDIPLNPRLLALDNLTGDDHLT